jgi:hypothetical protein
MIEVMFGNAAMVTVGTKAVATVTTTDAGLLVPPGPVQIIE